MLSGAMPPLGGAPARATSGNSSSKGTPTQSSEKNAHGAALGAGPKSQAQGGGSGGGSGAGSKATRDPSKLCKCKKSKCVRQYCVCFRAGMLLLFPPPGVWLLLRLTVHVTCDGGHAPCSWARE